MTKPWKKMSFWAESLIEAGERGELGGLAFRA